MGADFRQQEELQQEQQADILALLTRVQERCGTETAVSVAIHLGMRKEFQQVNERKVA